MTWFGWLMVALIGAGSCTAGWEWGRWHPAERCLEDLFEARYGRRLDEAYDEGYARGSYGVAPRELREGGDLKGTAGLATAPVLPASLRGGGDAGGISDPAPSPASAWGGDTGSVATGEASVDARSWKSGAGPCPADEPPTQAGMWLERYAELDPDRERVHRESRPWIHPLVRAQLGADSVTDYVERLWAGAAL